ncbi:MAG: hypothetical protein H5T69_10225 [Chloroflexi bacterium]|nr:hypothetical protein [Chloroflexota bacterium]
MRVLRRMPLPAWGVISSVLSLALFVACVARPTSTPLPTRQFPTLAPSKPTTEQPTKPSAPTATLVSAVVSPQATGVANPSIGSPSPTLGAVTSPTEAVRETRVTVNELELQIAPSMPVQITVILRGTLPESCVAITDITQRVSEDTILLELQAVRPVDLACAQVLTPFEVTTILALQGIKPGRYTVRAGEAQATIELTDEMLRPPQAEGTRPPIAPAGEAPVESVQAHVMESFPTRVSLTIRGNMPDSCTQVGHFSQRLSGNTIYLTVYAARSPDRPCVQTPTPYESTLPLDLSGLSIGDYVVNVNGVTTTLSVGPDMVVTPIPGAPLSQSPEGEVISGRAAVESVTLLGQTPLTATLTVRGNLPDGCTRIADEVQAVQGHTIHVELFTERPTDKACTQALVPFETTVTIELQGLDAGAYIVDVNGVKADLSVGEAANSSPSPAPPQTR